MSIAYFTNGAPEVGNGLTTASVGFEETARQLGELAIILVPGSGQEDDPPSIRRLPSFLNPPGSPYPIANPRAYSAWSQESFRHDVRAVVSNDPYIMNWIGGVEARVRSVPHVGIAHTDYPDYSRHHPKWLPEWIRQSACPPIHQAWIKHAYRKCDTVVAPSEWQRHNLIKWGVPRQKIQVIPTAVPLVPETELKSGKGLRLLHGIPEDATVLLYLGRISPEKNMDLLVATFRELRTRSGGSDIHLVTVGKGISPELEALSRQYFGQVHLLGDKPHPEAMALLSMADMLLMPSTNETQGIAIMEARRRGIPVVTTNKGAGKESVIQAVTGYWVPDTPGEMADAVMAVLCTNMKESTWEVRNGPDIFCPDQVAEKWRKILS